MDYDPVAGRIAGAVIDARAPIAAKGQGCVALIARKRDYGPLASIGPANSPLSTNSRWASK
jgi:hypothetical protein